MPAWEMVDPVAQSQTDARVTSTRAGELPHLEVLWLQTDASGLTLTQTLAKRGLGLEKSQNERLAVDAPGQGPGYRNATLRSIEKCGNPVVPRTCPTSKTWIGCGRLGHSSSHF